MSRRTRPWTEDELARVRAWRDLPDPPTFGEIGRWLGGRSEQSVRLKLYEARLKTARAAAWPAGADGAERGGPEPMANRDHVLVTACRRDGGFSAFSSQHLRGRVWALCRPVVGAGGIARPPGWRDGKPAEMRSEADLRHLAELAHWWKARDRQAREAPDEGRAAFGWASCSA